jgi:hypothetical protein
MRLDISTRLPCTLDQSVSQVMTTRLLQYVSYPLVSFTFLDAPQFPRTWTAGTHWVFITLFGFLPFGRQAIVISIPPVETGFALRDAGHSTLIPVWNHLITIDPIAGGVVYRDRVEVRAGVLTPFIWVFAQLLYRYQQRRWRQLAVNGFDYGESGASTRKHR